jgi:hypothetical protein
VRLNARLCFTVATVEDLATRGELPATKFGRGWTFVTAQVLALAAERSLREASERKKQHELSRPRIRIAEEAPVAPKKRGRPRKEIPGFEQ